MTKNIRNKIKTFLLLVLNIAVIMAFNGYRLSGEAAARANTYVDKKAELIDHTHFDWGTVYMFRNADKPVTAVSRKYLGFLWVSRTTVYYLPHSDSINTVGGVILDEPEVKATVLTFEVNDPEVKYLAAGKSKNKRVKSVANRRYITFSWGETIPWNEMEYVAYNDRDEPIYTFDRTDNEIGFRWHEVK